jgi:hypothetical protein
MSKPAEFNALKNLAEYSCKAYSAARFYKSFVNIPAYLESEDFIFAWIAFGGRLGEIPPEKRTELIMRVSVNYDDNALQHITPGDVRDYRAIVIDAFNKSPRSIRLMDREYITEELAIRFVSEHVASFWYLDLGVSNQHLLTAPLMSAVAKHGIGGFHYLKAKYGAGIHDKFDDGFFVEAINANRNNIWRLKDIGKEYLLVDLLRSGYWPDGFDPMMDMKADYTLDISLPPKNPHEAMARLAEIQGEDARYLHLTALKLYPIEEVISATATLPNATEILLEEYSEAQLGPHMKLSRALRGRLLESSLGL